MEQRADRIAEERREGGGGEVEPNRAEGEGKGKAAGDGEGPPADGGDSRSAAAKPPVEHHDSGGGAAQFSKKGSDNSIQEFGQEGGASELQQAAAVLHAYLAAKAARRWEEACSHLSAQVVASLEQFGAAYGGEKQIEGCPDLLETLNSRSSDTALKESAQADVGSLRMEGDRGFLLYHGPGGMGYAIPVTEEGGAWKLAAPEGTVLP
ncbi:MAG TPA: hypothetical protein VD741_08965 [Solirubrobacterales bacterium]|nr:hypothetical protein [Solirubrobacterales bacterium]